MGWAPAEAAKCRDLLQRLSAGTATAHRQETAAPRDAALAEVLRQQRAAEVEDQRLLAAAVGDEDTIGLATLAVGFWRHRNTSVRTAAELRSTAPTQDARAALVAALDAAPATDYTAAHRAALESGSFDALARVALDLQRAVAEPDSGAGPEPPVAPAVDGGLDRFRELVEREREAAADRTAAIARTIDALAMAAHSARDTAESAKASAVEATRRASLFSLPDEMPPSPLLAPLGADPRWVAHALVPAVAGNAETPADVAARIGADPDHVAYRSGDVCDEDELLPVGAALVVRRAQSSATVAPITDALRQQTATLREVTLPELSAAAAAAKEASWEVEVQRLTGHGDRPERDGHAKEARRSAEAARTRVGAAESELEAIEAHIAALEAGDVHALSSLLTVARDTALASASECPIPTPREHGQSPVPSEHSLPPSAANGDTMSPSIRPRGLHREGDRTPSPRLARPASRPTSPVLRPTVAASAATAGCLAFKAVAVPADSTAAEVAERHGVPEADVFLTDNTAAGRTAAAMPASVSADPAAATRLAYIPAPAPRPSLVALDTALQRALEDWARLFPDAAPPADIATQLRAQRAGDVATLSSLLNTYRREAQEGTTEADAVNAAALEATKARDDAAVAGEAAAAAAERCAVLEAALQESETALRDSEAAAAALRADVAALEANSGDARSVARERDAALRREEELKDAADALRFELERARRTADAAIDNDEMVRLERALAAAEAEARETQEDKEHALAQAAALREQLAAARAQVCDAEAEATRLGSDVAATRRRAEEAERRLEAAQQHARDKGTASTEQAQQQAQQHAQMLAAAEAKAAATLSAAEEHRGAADAAASELSALRSELDAAHRRASTDAAALQELEAQVDRVRRQLADSERRVAECDAGAAAKDDQVAALRRELEVAARHLAEQRDETAAAERRCADAVAREETAALRIAELEHARQLPPPMEEPQPSPARSDPLSVESPRKTAELEALLRDAIEAAEAAETDLAGQRERWAAERQGFTERIDDLSARLANYGDVVSTNPSGVVSAAASDIGQGGGRKRAVMVWQEAPTREAAESLAREAGQDARAVTGDCGEHGAFVPAEVPCRPRAEADAALQRSFDDLASSEPKLAASLADALSALRAHDPAGLAEMFRRHVVDGPEVPDIGSPPREATVRRLSSRGMSFEILSDYDPMAESVNDATADRDTLLRKLQLLRAAYAKARRRIERLERRLLEEGDGGLAATLEQQRVELEKRLEVQSQLLETQADEIARLQQAVEAAERRRESEVACVLDARKQLVAERDATIADLRSELTSERDRHNATLLALAAE